jgi:hypothetical protein
MQNATNKNQYCQKETTLTHLTYKVIRLLNLGMTNVILKQGDFMKKQLALAAGLAVLAAPAFASKARLAALGEDVNGSFYIQDNRNIFLNASEVNNNKDFVTFELENDGGNGEGGFIRNAGNLVWGAHMGRNLSYNTSLNELDALGTGGSNALDASNALDLFIGGDAGIKWGVQLTRSTQEDEGYVDGSGTSFDGEAETSVMDLAVGVSQGAWGAYLKYGLSGTTEHKESTVELDAERTGAWEIGGSYNWNGYTAFIQRAQSTFEEKESDSEIESSSTTLGVARQDKLNDKAVLFTKVAYNMANSDIKDGDEESSNDLTATIGLEFDAASWLTLRGSVAQEILINNEETDPAAGSKVKSTEANTTVVAAGATLKFGDLSVDGVAGNAANTNGVIDSSNFMTRVSMTYRF